MHAVTLDCLPKLNRIWPPLLASGWLMIGVPTCPAQQEERNDRSRGDEVARVILYDRPNFHGQSIELAAGVGVDNLAFERFADGRSANDAISSIQVEPGAEVVLFTDSHFRGGSIRLTQSVSNLADVARGGDSSWIEVVSSLRVEAAPRREQWRHEDRQEARVIVYRKANFGGDAMELFPGEAYENLSGKRYDSGKGINDSISSIRVIGAVRLLAYADAKFRGPVLEVTADLPDLTQVLADPQGTRSWNDMISSLRVERVGRPADDDTRDSDRRRPGQHGRGNDHRDAPSPNFDQLVRQQFQELLGRAPTAEERAGYTRHLADDAWSRDMLRADIRRSREFRQREADAIIDRAYREVLGREADPGGRDSFRKHIIEDNMSESQVRDALLRSPEYTDKKHADAVALVTRVYREILGREPEPAGLQSYVRVVLKKGWNERRMQDELRRSDEYKARAKKSH